MNMEQKTARGTHADVTLLAVFPHGMPVMRKLQRNGADMPAVLPAGCLFAGVPAHKLHRLQTLRGGHWPPL